MQTTSASMGNRSSGKAPAVKRSPGHVPAGLDHAVRQAKERGLDRMFIVDVDCHQYEPFDLFEDRLDVKWRSLLKKTYAPDYTGLNDPLYSGRPSSEGRFPYNKTRRFEWQFGRIKRPEVTGGQGNQYGPTGDIEETIQAFYIDGMSAEKTIETFSARMRDIGIKRSVVLPTRMLSLGVNPDPEFEVAMANAYVDTMAENFLEKYPEILTFLYAPANSPSEAADLIDRMGSKRGIVGVMITPYRKKLAGDEDWVQIYEAAQRKGLPVCFHGDRNFGGPFEPFDTFLTVHALSFPFSLMLMMTSLVMKGIPERFPKLRFCFMEGGLSWVPFVMHRLDHEYLLRRREAPLLKKLPSEYIKDFYFSSQPLEHVEASKLQHIFDLIDAENHLMYASDYPHWDFDTPSVVYDLPFLSKAAKKKILGENARGFFRID